MNRSINTLTLDFLTWLSARPRTYAETMDAWRSSCPRLSIWEDALHDGLITIDGSGDGRPSTVALTPRGRMLLDAQS